LAAAAIGKEIEGFEKPLKSSEIPSKVYKGKAKMNNARQFCKALYRYEQEYEQGHVRERGISSELRLFYSLLLGIFVIIFALFIALIWALITV
jgi:hypothetical protein